MRVDQFIKRPHNPFLSTKDFYLHNTSSIRDHFFYSPQPKFLSLVSSRDNTLLFSQSLQKRAQEKPTFSYSQPSKQLFIPNLQDAFQGLQLRSQDEVPINFNPCHHHFNRSLNPSDFYHVISKREMVRPVLILSHSSIWENDQKTSLSNAHLEA